MNYREAMEYIEGIQSYGIVPGLDSIRELCRRIGDPQDQLRFVHIAGTNGKGSVLAYLSTILQCAGYKVGRYSSPAVFEYRERIQVNGRNITQKALCEGMEIIKSACYEMRESGLPHPTPFEVETALAFWYFAQKDCDIVVLEAGMGGLLDATNVIRNTVLAVFTSIGMDHVQFLGSTIQEIAGQKAGILKEGCAAVAMQQSGEVLEVIRREAEIKHCELHVTDRDCLANVRYGSGSRPEVQRFDCRGKSGDHPDRKNLEIRLAGRFQVDNALLAIEAADVLKKKGFRIEEDALRAGLAQTVWRGRFSVIGKKPLFLADGAHNEDAALKLADSIEFYFTNRRIIYIMGMLRDKEYGKVIGITHRYADQILTITPPDNPRALHAYELAKEIAKVHPNVTAADSLEEAVEMARLMAGPKDVILAFGSLSFLGRLIKLVEG